MGRLHTAAKLHSIQLKEPLVHTKPHVYMGTQAGMDWNHEINNVSKGC
jgi:hypothetical protein